jgi:3-hydroxy-3-methylglutaryl CoA synthase
MLASVEGPVGARILGMGHYRPANVITNHDLIARGVDTDDEWIKSRVGIAERRWADPDETVIDMAEAAASKALATSGVATGEVDLVLVATCTMPEPIPAAAPSARITQVLRSFMSSHPENRSVATSSTLRACPARIAASAAAWPYSLPEQPDVGA